MVYKKYIIIFIFFLVSLSIQDCSKETTKKTDIVNINGNEFSESFRKTGWITDKKYRAVIFIITLDECKKSSLTDIEDKIKFEAYKNLQKELNPSFNRNASIQIKNLADNSGKLIKQNRDCVESNIYVYDLEKNDLKAEFEKIKNIK